jgi:hypothetical protein
MSLLNVSSHSTEARRNLSWLSTRHYPFPQQALTPGGWEQTLLYLGLLWAVVLVVVVVYGPGRLMRRCASGHIQEAVGGQQAGTSFPPDGHVF